MKSVCLFFVIFLSGCTTTTTYVDTCTVGKISTKTEYTTTTQGYLYFETPINVPVLLDRPCYKGPLPPK